jgi:predicted RNA-binding protein YlxR (DUF448 family)
MGGTEPAQTDEPVANPAPQVADGQPAAAHEPDRTCAVTRAKLSSAELIRFVRAPDGTITPDLAHRLPGRGVWIALDHAVVEKAAAQNAFARSLKQAVTVPADLAALVEQLMRERCVQALALANKAGLVVAGFAKVEAAIGSGRVAALLHASEASPDGAAKLDGKFRARLTQALDATGAGSELALIEGSVVVTDLAGRELSLALGRENVVHAAVIRGGAARYFLTEVERLRRYRSSSFAAASRPHRTRSNTEQV